MSYKAHLLDHKPKGVKEIKKMSTITEIKKLMPHQLEALKNYLNSKGGKVEKCGIVWFGQNSHAIYVNDTCRQFYNSYNLIDTYHFISGLLQSDYTIKAMIKASKEAE
jgi:hypothetical protein